MQIHSSKLLLSDCSVIVKIIAYPANATVTINGIKTSELEIKKGEIVSWSVSFTGYYSQSGKFEAKKDVELTITLGKILYTFSITTSPTSAKVVMNGVETKSVTVEPGTNVAWEVSATGYYSQSGNQIVTENTSKKITLSSKTKVISVSSATKTSYDDERIYGCPYTAYGNSYRFPYSFIKGRSYTIKYSTSIGPWVYEAFTSTATGVNTSTPMSKGQPTTLTQTIFSTNNGSNATSGISVNKTFTASADASYIFLNLKSTQYYPTVGSLTIIDNT